MNPCGLPITKFASTSCLSQIYISSGRIPRYLFLLQNMTHICYNFLLWCDEDCGFFFDDPIIKEGIVLRFVSGKFQKIRKKSTEEIFPEYPEIYLISESIRPNKHPFHSHVGPRRNMTQKPKGTYPAFSYLWKWRRNKYRSVCHSLTIFFRKPEKFH